MRSSPCSRQSWVPILPLASNPLSPSIQKPDCVSRIHPTSVRPCALGKLAPSPADDNDWLKTSGFQVEGCDQLVGHKVNLVACHQHKKKSERNRIDHIQHVVYILNMEGTAQ